eukprot:3135957-Amphidinium_carterae.1
MPRLEKYTFADSLPCCFVRIRVGLQSKSLLQLLHHSGFTLVIVKIKQCYWQAGPRPTPREDISLRAAIQHTPSAAHVSIGSNCDSLELVGAVNLTLACTYLVVRVLCGLTTCCVIWTAFFERPAMPLSPSIAT